MRYQQLAGAVVLAGFIGCSGVSQIETLPAPSGSVGTRGTVVTNDGAVLTTGERSTAATLGIPPGHLPEAGECRVWEPGRPPGQQRGLPQGACELVERRVQPHQWLVYRPGTDRKIVEVRSYDSLPGGGVAVRLIQVFDIASGVLVSERDER
ncbi:MAG: hypothetical protein OEU54_17635 [Gemmatimonadota bacterium]|nr:hypothetical protein [Gemmatimonadota bacterium]